MRAPEASNELLQMRCDHLVERNGLMRHLLSEIRRISAPEPASCAHQWLLLVTAMADVQPMQTWRFCHECRHIERVQ